MNREAGRFGLIHRIRRFAAAVLRGLGAVILLVLATAITLRLLHPLPDLEPRTPSTHVTGTEDTPLGRGVAALSEGAEAGHSGVHLLTEGRDAFAARILLARTAVRSIDIQYYIWRADQSGTLLLEAMREAADRGVRVRVLLDDNGIAGMDRLLAALDEHPGIEIRLFNPFVLRRPKMLGYLTDFSRLNRRMHNKSFTVDNQATIIGGRNIGDEYFSARDDGLFLDLDVLAVGPIVEDVSADFDRYWASESSYPAERILPRVPPEEIAGLARSVSLVERDPAARDYLEAIRALPFVDQAIAGTLPLEWALVRVVSDDPAKGVGGVPSGALLIRALRDAMGDPQRELKLISAYFVPGSQGVDALSALAARGVDVAVFTNSFEATDVWMVHAGYAERRRRLLEAGVRLFEMRGPVMADGERSKRRLTGTGSGSGAGSDGPVLRSAASTLHAKTFSTDGRRLFIGSFNFDPRSIALNTELGFVIESTVLAEGLADAFRSSIPSYAYEVVLGGDGRIHWLERTPDGLQMHSREPGTTRMQRWVIAVLSRLPIEWLL